MSIFNSFILTTIAGMSTLLGAIPIFFKIKDEYINKFITLSLAFSLAIMIGVSITDLFPTSFFYLFFHYPKINAFAMVILPFSLGIILILLINKLTNNTNSLYKLGILNMITLMLHNFPEGIATFMSSITNMELGIKLAIAIIIHNIPEGISIAVPIYYATKSRKKAILNTFISGMAEPLGAILTYLILYSFVNETLISIVLILVAGIMITLAIHEMLPASLNYHENKYLLYGLILGIILIIINVILM